MSNKVLQKLASNHAIAGLISPAWQKHKISRDYGVEGDKNWGQVLGTHVGGRVRQVLRAGVEGGLSSGLARVAISRVKKGPVAIAGAAGSIHGLVASVQNQDREMNEEAKNKSNKYLLKAAEAVQAHYHVVSTSRKDERDIRRENTILQANRLLREKGFTPSLDDGLLAHEEATHLDDLVDKTHESPNYPHGRVFLSALAGGLAGAAGGGMLVKHPIGVIAGGIAGTVGGGAAAGKLLYTEAKRKADEEHQKTHEENLMNYLRKRHKPLD